jgi:hypothetical protein
MHEGKLRITGTAPDKLEFVWVRDGLSSTSHVGRADLDEVEMDVDDGTARSVTKVPRGTTWKTDGSAG